jgi:multicomponent Na+:H+ antiporter subunit E
MLIVAKRFVLLFGLWLALTLNDPSAWIVGALAAGAAAGVSLRLAPPRNRALRLANVAALFPGFLWRSLLGGADVAWRAFHPRLPLRPKWIDYPVRLPPGAPRVSLGSELSLMPGTLAAGADGDILYVHCLDSAQPVEAQIGAEEARIAASLGLSLEPSHE